MAAMKVVLPPPRPKVRAASSGWPNAPRRNLFCQGNRRNGWPANRPCGITSPSMYRSRSLAIVCCTYTPLSGGLAPPRFVPAGVLKASRWCHTASHQLLHVARQYRLPEGVQFGHGHTQPSASQSATTWTSDISSAARAVSRQASLRTFSGTPCNRLKLIVCAMN